MNILISIIVPIYKVERYLRHCIDSLLSQDYQHIEIILVDDGSPDSCGKMVDEYAAKDERILAIHQQNIDFMNKEQEKAFGFTAKETGLTLEEVKIMAPWYDFSTKITEKDIKDLEETQDFLLLMGMQKNKIDIKSLLAEVK